MLSCLQFFEAFLWFVLITLFVFLQAEDGIRDDLVTGVQTCALPICRPPLDPKSNEAEFRTELTIRFENDSTAETQLGTTVRLDRVRQEDYDTVFYPGGHGPMWDLADDPNSIKLIESFIAAGKTTAVVCHSTGALRHVKAPDGTLLVRGKKVTGFTNGEEDEVGLTKVVPFLVEGDRKSTR